MIFIKTFFTFFYFFNKKYFLCVFILGSTYFYIYARKCTTVSSYKNEQDTSMPQNKLLTWK